MNELRVIVVAPNRQRLLAVESHVMDIVHELADSYPGRGVLLFPVDSVNRSRGIQADYAIVCEGITKDQWQAVIPCLAWDGGSVGRIIKIGDIPWV